MPSDALEEIIDAGHDIASIKYYGVAVATVYFYDWLLTLEDEVKYVWCGRKSWPLALFLVNRYLPIGYQLWMLIMCYRPTFFQRVYDLNLINCQISKTHTDSHHRCDKTAFVSVLAFVGTTLLAQVVLTLRIYAVTSKNWLITSCFGAITISQFILGLYLTTITAMQGAQQVLPIPLDPYRICVFVRHRPLEIGFTTISLIYDSLTFLLIIYLALRSNVCQFQTPSLFRTIIQDATYYFLVIFTSHLLLEMTLLFANPTLQLLPAGGNVVYLPVMITRLLLSLKKAAAARGELEGWTFGEPTLHPIVGLAEHRGVFTPRDEIHLDVFASARD